jgi:hypothetical protein
VTSDAIRSTGLGTAAKSLMVIVIMTVVTYPIFLVLYRMMIFQTVPRDDYAPYLLWIAGAPTGALPGSPYIYRYFSMLLAWPFYHLLPVFHLTNIPQTVDATYERATAALAMLSDIAAIAAAVLTFDIARRGGKPTLVSTLSAVFIYGGCWFTQIEGIDSVTILGIVIVVLLLRVQDRYFLALIPLTFVNEKITIIAFLFLAIRSATSAIDRQLLHRKLAVAVVALAAYVGALGCIHAGGNAYQVTPSGYLANFITNIEVNLSFRGVLLSWAPSALLLVLALIGTHNDPSSLFSKRDALLIPALIAVALTLTRDFQVGRIVMMAIPVFAIPAAERLARSLDPRHQENYGMVRSSGVA